MGDGNSPKQLAAQLLAALDGNGFPRTSQTLRTFAGDHMLVTTGLPLLWEGADAARRVRQLPAADAVRAVGLLTDTDALHHVAANDPRLRVQQAAARRDVALPAVVRVMEARNRTAKDLVRLQALDLDRHKAIPAAAATSPETLADSIAKCRNATVQKWAELELIEMPVDVPIPAAVVATLAELHHAGTIRERASSIMHRAVREADATQLATYSDQHATCDPIDCRMRAALPLTASEPGQRQHETPPTPPRVTQLSEADAAWLRESCSGSVTALFTAAEDDSVFAAAYGDGSAFHTVTDLATATEVANYAARQWPAPLSVDVLTVLMRNRVVRNLPDVLLARLCDETVRKEVVSRVCDQERDELADLYLYRTASTPAWVRQLRETVPLTQLLGEIGHPTDTLEVWYSDLDDAELRNHRKQIVAQLRTIRANDIERFLQLADGRWIPGEAMATLTSTMWRSRHIASVPELLLRSMACPDTFAAVLSSVNPGEISELLAVIHDGGRRVPAMRHVIAQLPGGKPAMLQAVVDSGTEVRDPISLVRAGATPEQVMQVAERHPGVLQHLLEETAEPLPPQHQEFLLRHAPAPALLRAEAARAYAVPAMQAALGDEPELWTSLVGLAEHWEGTLPELLEAVQRLN